MTMLNNNDLNVLVQELSKKNPNAELIVNKTKSLGIPYSNDPIILMSEVLVFLAKTNPKPPFQKEKQV